MARRIRDVLCDRGTPTFPYGVCGMVNLLNSSSHNSDEFGFINSISCHSHNTFSLSHTLYFGDSCTASCQTGNSSKR